MGITTSQAVPRFLIVLAAGKIHPSLVGDFGNITHARIPFKGQPVYFETLRNFQNFDETFLVIDSEDAIGAAYSSLQNATVLRTRGNQDLGQSLLKALDEISSKVAEYFHIQVIFGDTLTSEVLSKDFIGVAEPQSDYSDWSSVNDVNQSIQISIPGKNDEKIVGGYFGFSQPLKLQSYLRECEFFDAVMKYFSFIQNSDHTMVDMQSWKDFGRANTFYLSRSREMISRTFNSVEFDSSNWSVLKSSFDKNKIEDEINWYLDLQNRGVSHVAPSLLSYDIPTAKYQLAFISEPTVAEIYLYGEKSNGYWVRLFSSITNLLEMFRDPVEIKELNLWKVNLRESYLSQLDSRVKMLSDQHPEIFEAKFSAEIGAVTVEDLVTAMKQWLHGYNPLPNKFGHGDLFFGNMFFQDKINRVICIDPRGLNKERPIYDFNYEFAKINHSLIGGYDFLAGNLFELISEDNVYRVRIPVNESQVEIQQIGWDLLQNYRTSIRLESNNFGNLVPFLFITMSPLHSENFSRQIAALCLAAQLFVWK